jgi:quinol-cytochrome oxidoreductase complex cytochrome b subunit
VQNVLSSLCILIFSYILLGFVGHMHPVSPWLELGRVATLYYFMFFLICFVLCVGSFFRKKKISLKNI